MGYRDELAALSERLRSVEAAERETAAEVRELERAIEERKAANLPAPARRWPLVVAALCALTLATVVWATYGPARAQTRERKARLQSMREEQGKVERVLQAKRSDSYDVLDRFDAGPPADDHTSVYASLRKLDCNDEEQARVIVGAAACALGYEKAAAAAREASGPEAQRQLKDLCAEVGTP